MTYNDGDVKPYSLTHSLTQKVLDRFAPNFHCGGARFGPRYLADAFNVKLLHLAR